MRGERLWLDAPIAQFEVLPESEVLRTPGGQKREHRARERKTEDVFANCQPPGLYKDHHSTTPLRVSLDQNVQPPPSQNSILSIFPNFFTPCDLDRWIGRSNGPDPPGQPSLSWTRLHARGRR